ncbi:E3 ubiquitin-protein ligase TRIM56-like [Haliotis asinina]|uniref:E3 ubiquitin-protein ligase TRIM56-like n=1 Tax=Haliotis asinina TaxID=109174 RepID=UPI0035326C4A
MSATIQLDDDFFVCSICNDSFSDPRSLPCLHSFCHQCLQQHINYSATFSPPSFLCPVCRGLVLVPSQRAPPSTWADCFPGNFLMKDLMARRASGSQSASPAAASGDLQAVARDVWCLEHPNCPLNMFCVSCEATSCGKCMLSKHINCSVVKLVSQGKSPTEDIGIFVERLKSEIKSVQDRERCIQDELAYFEGQAEKVRTRIHEHITRFYTMLEEEKRKLLFRMDTEYQNLTKGLASEQHKAKDHLAQLKNLISAAAETLTQDPDTIRQMARRIENTLASVSSAEKLQRMRISFSPDFSCLDKDFSLGSVRFYNSRVPASAGVTATVPRSRSSDCMSSCQEEPVALRQHTTSVLRSTSVPCFDESWRREELGRVNEQTSSVTRIPGVERGHPDSTVGGNCTQHRESASRIRHSAPVFLPSGESDAELAQPVMTPEVPENVSSSRNSYNGCKLAVDLNTDSGESAFAQKKLIPSSVMQTYQLSTSDDESLPVVTSIVVLSGELFMVADEANKSVKIFNKDGLCSSVSFQYKPHGLAAASEDRALVSFPDQRKIVVISVGKELKVISTIQSTKSYSRLKHYRPGMTAALHTDTSSLDILSLQGKVMKTFNVFDSRRVDIPFSVDKNQGFVILDSSNSNLIWKSRTGNTTCQATVECIKRRVVSDLACDLLGNVYIVQDGGVVKVTSKGDYSGDVVNVFSCQAICFYPSGHLFVAEIGGHCKVHSL